GDVVAKGVERHEKDVMAPHERPRVDHGRTSDKPTTRSIVQSARWTPAGYVLPPLSQQVLMPTRAAPTISLAGSSPTNRASSGAPCAHRSALRNRGAWGFDARSSPEIRTHPNDSERPKACSFARCNGPEPFVTTPSRNRS